MSGYAGVRWEHRDTGGVFDKLLGRVIYPRDDAWREYHDWTMQGGIPDADTTPAPVIVPQYAQIDFAALGKARELRKLEREAETNPILAELLKGKWNV